MAPRCIIIDKCAYQWQSLAMKKKRGQYEVQREGGRLVFHRHLKWSKTFINDTTPSLGTTVNTLNVHGLG
jgi:hypothetical protein